MGNNVVNPRERYVSIFLLFMCSLAILGGNYFLFFGITKAGVSEYIIFFLWVYLLIKMIVIDKFITNKWLYYTGKVIDIIIISFVSVTDLFGINSFAVLFMLLSLLIALSALITDAQLVKANIIFSLISYFQMSIMCKVFDSLDFQYFLYFISLLFIGLFVYRFSLSKEKYMQQIENQINELRVLNEELTNTNNEIKYKLEDLKYKNERASKSLAELSTIQEVSQVINSTLDMKELFILLNDIIIGVMGVTYCTIFLKEEGEQKISIQSSNITNQTCLAELRDKVGLKAFELMEKGHKVLSNVINPYQYPYAIERGIQSITFVPIINKGKVLGLILAEHTIEKGLSDETKKFIETLANQVGLALENAILYKKMEIMATTDALTGVYNRLYFQKYFTEEFEKAKGEKSLCIIMLDIDKFKRFNDTYGHDFGDEVLKSTAKLAHEYVGSEGIVARYGGEEFVILYKNTNLERGYELAENLRKLIEKNIVKYNNKAVNVTVSMGVSAYPQTANNQEDLLKTADEALYRAKEDGRNCVRKATLRMQPRDF